LRAWSSSSAGPTCRASSACTGSIPIPTGEPSWRIGRIGMASCGPSPGGTPAALSRLQASGQGEEENFRVIEQWTALPVSPGSAKPSWPMPGRVQALPGVRVPTRFVSSLQRPLAHINTYHQIY
jgi:hypothetical protein